MRERLSPQQVSRILRVDIKTIRNWEREFSNFLWNGNLEAKPEGFDENQLEIFSQIKELLHTEQYTTKGAKRRLELDRTLSCAMGVEHNLKTTVFQMFSAIMEELQQAKEESKRLANEVYHLTELKKIIEIRLYEEQNKNIFEFIKTKLQGNQESDKMGTVDKNQLCQPER
ncbi:MAG: MerR family transcriptional regulator [Bacillota bacterium]